MLSYHLILVTILTVSFVSALQMTVPTKGYAGQSISLQWTLSTGDPPSFDLLLRDDTHSPASFALASVDTGGKKTGKLQVPLLSTLQSGNYRTEAYPLGKRPPLNTLDTSTNPPLTSSNEIKISAIATASDTTDGDSSATRAEQTTSESSVEATAALSTGGVASSQSVTTMTITSIQSLSSTSTQNAKASSGGSYLSNDQLSPGNTNAQTISVTATFQTTQSPDASGALFPSPSPSDRGDSPMPIGATSAHSKRSIVALVGGFIGGLGGILLFIMAVYFLRRSGQRRRQATNSFYRERMVRTAINAQSETGLLRDVTYSSPQTEYVYSAVDFEK